jgi:hypothetical protein
MTDAYADKIPIASTLTTVKQRMQTLNILPKVPAFLQIAVFG